MKRTRSIECNEATPTSINLVHKLIDISREPHWHQCKRRRRVSSTSSMTPSPSITSNQYTKSLLNSIVLSLDQDEAETDRTSAKNGARNTTTLRSNSRTKRVSSHNSNKNTQKTKLISFEKTHTIESEQRIHVVNGEYLFMNQYSRAFHIHNSHLLDQLDIHKRNNIRKNNVCCCSFQLSYPSLNLQQQQLRQVSSQKQWQIQHLIQIPKVTKYNKTQFWAITKSNHLIQYIVLDHNNNNNKNLQTKSTGAHQVIEMDTVRLNRVIDLRDHNQENCYSFHTPNGQIGIHQLNNESFLLYLISAKHSASQSYQILVFELKTKQELNFEDFSVQLKLNWIVKPEDLVITTPITIINEDLDTEGATGSSNECTERRVKNKRRTSSRRISGDGDESDRRNVTMINNIQCLTIMDHKILRVIHDQKRLTSFFELPNFLIDNTEDSPLENRSNNNNTNTTTSNSLMMNLSDFEYDDSKFQNLSTTLKCLYSLETREGVFCFDSNFPLHFLKKDMKQHNNRSKNCIDTSTGYSIYDPYCSVKRPGRVERIEFLIDPSVGEDEILGPYFSYLGDRKGQLVSRCANSIAIYRIVNRNGNNKSIQGFKLEKVYEFNTRHYLEYSPPVMKTQRQTRTSTRRNSSSSSRSGSDDSNKNNNNSSMSEIQILDWMYLENLERMILLMSTGEIVFLDHEHEGNILSVMSARSDLELMDKEYDDDSDEDYEDDEDDSDEDYEDDEQSGDNGRRRTMTTRRSSNHHNQLSSSAWIHELDYCGEDKLLIRSENVGTHKQHRVIIYTMSSTTAVE